MSQRVPALYNDTVRFYLFPYVFALRIGMTFDLQRNRFNFHVIDNCMEAFFAGVKITDS